MPAARAAGNRALRRAVRLLFWAVPCAAPLAALTLVFDDWLLSQEPSRAKLWLALTLLPAMAAVVLTMLAILQLGKSREHILVSLEGRPIARWLLGPGLLVAAAALGAGAALAIHAEGGRGNLFKLLGGAAVLGFAGWRLVRSRRRPT
jgi:hypothetical protein